MNTKSTQRRRQILDAVSRVVRTKGVAALTLDAVAEEAAISKGGLLYHFPTKEALISGLIDQICADFDAAIEQEVANDPLPGPGRWLRAYIRCSCAVDEQPLDVLYAAIGSAVATNSALLDPLRAAFARWQSRAEADGLDPTLGTLVRLTVDGLWFADLLDFAPPRAELREQVTAQLLKLASIE